MNILSEILSNFTLRDGLDAFAVLLMSLIILTILFKWGRPK
jgi:hypothetical protein